MRRAETAGKRGVPLRQEKAYYRGPAAPAPLNTVRAGRRPPVSRRRYSRRAARQRQQTRCQNRQKTRLVPASAGAGRLKSARTARQQAENENLRSPQPNPPAPFPGRRCAYAREGGDSDLNSHCNRSRAPHSKGPTMRRRIPIADALPLPWPRSERIREGGRGVRSKKPEPHTPRSSCPRRRSRRSGGRAKRRADRRSRVRGCD